MNHGVPFRNPGDRDFHIHTPLREIRSIEIPPGPEWEAFGRAIADSVRRAGCPELAVRVAVNLPGLGSLSEGHQILIGSVHSNPAIAALYRRKHTLVDDFFPGPDGWVIQTVHNPGNIGHNAVIIGLSDSASMAGAQAAFAGILSESNGSLPYLNMVRSRLPIPRMSESECRRWKRKARAAFRANTGRDALERGIDAGLSYALTGYPEYLELFLFAFRHYHELVRSSGGEWEFEHMLFPYAWIWRLAWVWDMIEESSLLGSEDRSEIVIVLKGLAGYTSRLPYFRDPVLRRPAIRQNHPTFAALSMFFAGRYLGDHYGGHEFDQALQVAALIMDGQRGSYKPDDDAAGYCYLAPSHLLQYDLAHDDFRWIESGHLRRLCEYAEITTDNLGSPVSFGDATRYLEPGSCHRQLRGLFIAAAVFDGNGDFLRLVPPVTGDGFDLTPRHSELANDLIDSIGHYARLQDSSGPALSPGIQVAPLTEDALRLLEDKAPVASARRPWCQLFDKLALRAGAGAQDLYLLIDGVGGFVHDHEDAGSVLRLTWKNRMWLAEGDYIRSLPKYHNSLTVVCDGEAGPLPAIAVLEARVEQDGLTFIQVRIDAFNGVCWRRNIIWGRDRWILFVDTVDFLREADFVITNHWRLLGIVRSSQQSTTSRQGDVLFRIAHGDASQKSVASEPVREIRIHTGSFHVDYPHAGDPIKVLRQTRRIEKEIGAAGPVFFNLMTCGDGADVRSSSLQGMGEGRARLTDRTDGQVWEIVARGGAGKGYRVKADLLMISENHVRMLHCRDLKIDDLKATFSEPVFLEVDCVDSSVRVSAGPGTVVTGDLFDRSGPLERSVTRLQLRVDRDRLARVLNELTAGPEYLPPTRNGREATVDHENSLSEATIEQVTRLAGAPGAMAWSPVSRQLYVLRGSHEVVATGQGDEFVMGRMDRPVSVIRSLGLSGSAGLVVGGQGYLALLEESGAVGWQVALPISHYRVQKVNDIVVALLAENDPPCILACTDGWLVHCLDLNGATRWVTQIHHHAARSLFVGDVDGDGRKEILVGTEYHTSDLLESDGRVRWTIEGGPEFVALGFCDLDADGVSESIFGAESGAVYGVHSVSGKILWTANIGDRADVALVGMDRGAQALIVGSAGGELVRFGVGGRKLWRQNLGSSVVRLMPRPSGHGLTAITHDGKVVDLDFNGVTRGCLQVGGTVTGVSVGMRAGGCDVCYAGIADGRILRLTLPGR